MDGIFLISIFRLYPGFKKSFGHNSVRKNLFLSACFCFDSRLSLREMDQKFKNLNLVEPLAMETRTWSFNFVLSNYLDHTQNYMMQLEQCGHIVVEDLVTVK